MIYQDHNDDPVVRINNGLSLRHLTNDGCGFNTEIEDEPCLEVFDTEQAYSYNDLQPYYLLDILGSQDDSDTSSPFETFKKRMISMHPEDKILKEIIREGVGAAVKHNDIINFHYALYVEYREYPIDLSYLRCRQPERIQIGNSDIIKGLDLAFQTMKTGEMSYFFIHPDLAFGKAGCPPRIPKDAAILARLEVFDTDIPDETIAKDTGEFTLEKALKLAKTYHAYANDAFKHKNISTAINKYNKAVQYLLDARLINDAEDIMVKHLLCKMYSNLAVCHAKLNNPKKVCIAVNNAFRDCPELISNNAKLLYHSGTALRMLGDHKLAYKRLKMAVNLDPTNERINDAIKQLNEEMKTYSNYEKNLCSKMIGITTNKDNSNAEDEKLISVKSKDQEQNLLIDDAESSVTISSMDCEESSIINSVSDKF